MVRIAVDRGSARGKPGKFSTSVVFSRVAQTVTVPSNTTGRLARAAYTADVSRRITEPMTIRHEPLWAGGLLRVRHEPWPLVETVALTPFAVIGKTVPRVVVAESGKGRDELPGSGRPRTARHRALRDTV
jgi:hypothetical protein